MYIFKSQSTQRERVTRGACHRRPAKCEKAINLSTHAHRGLHAVDMWNMVCWYRFYGVIFKIIPHNCVYSASDVCDFCTACRLDAYSSSFVKWQLIEKKERIIKQEMSHANSYQRCIQLQKTANMTTIGYRAIRYVLLTTKGGGVVHNGHLIEIS